MQSNTPVLAVSNGQPMAKPDIKIDLADASANDIAMNREIFMKGRVQPSPDQVMSRTKS
jgi:hypothetical protein